MQISCLKFFYQLKIVSLSCRPNVVVNVCKNGTKEKDDAPEPNQMKEFLLSLILLSSETHTHEGHLLTGLGSNEVGGVVLICSEISCLRCFFKIR